ncbi:hypothetical protein DH2020_022069 [Rehmannia glutinosa]|uniref:DUF3741 domain-containing protein n=1 Tax=Rehmannia glutinosa TaxID=99300 RepID=A0ABR0WGP8_REHGL
MKASSSSSSPFSCNGHETLPFSINRKTTGWCITRILRRILCFSSVSSSSCPFDYVNEDEIRNSSMVSGTPGIVARLMGLDSIPIKKSRSPRNVSRLANSRMRRTLSEDLENCEKSKEKRALLINNNGFGKKEKLSRLRRSLKQNVYHEIGELATMEVMNLSWLDDEISRNKLHLNEIGTDLASKILHQLLDELLINLEFF